MNKRSIEAQDKLFDSLKKAKEIFPELRTGQLLINVYNFWHKANKFDFEFEFFNVEDIELSQRINDYVNHELVKKLAGIK